MTERLVAESWDWLDLLESKYNEERWYVDQLLPENGRVMIEAPQESFKSTFTQQLALCVSTGTDFLGLHTDKPHKVLYLQSEGDLSDSALRGKAMHAWLPLPERGMLTWDFLLRRKINTRAGLQALRELCDIHDLHDGVLFIDPAYKTIRGSMKDDDVVGEWTDNIDFALHERNSSCVVVHHEVRPTTDMMGSPTRTGAGERMYGSAVWQYWASYGFQLRRAAGRGKSVNLTCWKNRRPTVFDGHPLALTVVEPYPFGLELAEAGVNSTMATIRALLRIGGERLTKQDIATRMGLSLPPVQQAVEALVGLDQLAEDDERPRKYYVKEA